MIGRGSAWQSQTVESLLGELDQVRTAPPEWSVITPISIRTAITDEHQLQNVPIDIDQFENGEQLGDPPTSERVIRFLLTHDDSAYTRTEIADAIGADPETVGTNLTRLKQRGLVRHREPYWAVTDDSERASKFLTDRYDESVVTDRLETDDRPATTSTHRLAATAFFKRVYDCLDDAIEAMYLFGSVARGTATATSDVDVLAVITDDADFATVDDKLLAIAYDVQLEHGVGVEVHSIRAEEFIARRDRGDPFVRTVIEEGETDV